MAPQSKQFTGTGRAAKKAARRLKFTRTVRGDGHIGLELYQPGQRADQIVKVGKFTTRSGREERVIGRIEKEIADLSPRQSVDILLRRLQEEEMKILGGSVDTQELGLTGQNLDDLPCDEEKQDREAAKAFDVYSPLEPIEEELYFSAAQMAMTLDVTKSSITRQVKQHKILGFRRFKSNLLIPKEQFQNDQVIRGIVETITLFDHDHRAAWQFLTSKLFYGTETPRPIDKLRALNQTDTDAFETVFAHFKMLKTSQDYGDFM